MIEPNYDAGCWEQWIIGAEEFLIREELNPFDDDLTKSPRPGRTRW